MPRSQLFRPRRTFSAKAKARSLRMRVTSRPPVGSWTVSKGKISGGGRLTLPSWFRCTSGTIVRQHKWRRAGQTTTGMTAGLHSWRGWPMGAKRSRKANTTRSRKLSAALRKNLRSNLTIPGGSCRGARGLMRLWATKRTLSGWQSERSSLFR